MKLLLFRAAAVFVAVVVGSQIAGQNPQDREERRGQLGAALENGILRIGIDCSEAKPCNVRFGNTVHRIKTAANVRPSGQASGMVFIYVASTGDLAAGSIINLACERCQYVRGVTQFPPDSIPLFSWAVTKGAFDPATGMDFRADLSTKNIISGSGIITVENAGTTIVSIDQVLIGTHVLKAPKASESTCAPGEFSFDNEYYYVCVATNKWKRAALSNF